MTRFVAKYAQSESGRPVIGFKYHVTQKSQNRVLSVVPRTRIIYEYAP
jgi:hypothetical protein